MGTSIEDHISHICGTSIELYVSVMDVLIAPMTKASQRLAQGLIAEHKIMICANGASVANGLHFTSALMHHFEVERPALPIISLNTDMAIMTAAAQEGQYTDVFAKQIHAIGQKGDVLIVLTTSGNHDSILRAVEAANERGIDIIALSGRDGGVLATHLGPEDVEIRVAIDNTARIREMHLLILHCFCDVIEHILFGRLGLTQ